MAGDGEWFHACHITNVESKIDADNLGFNVGSSKNKDSQGLVRGGG